jgi:hypothetical protein
MQTKDKVLVASLAVTQNLAPGVEGEGLCVPAVLVLQQLLRPRKVKIIQVVVDVDGYPAKHLEISNHLIAVSKNVRGKWDLFDPTLNQANTARNGYSFKPFYAHVRDLGELRTGMHFYFADQQASVSYRRVTSEEFLKAALAHWAKPEKQEIINELVAAARNQRMEFNCAPRRLG